MKTHNKNFGVILILAICATVIMLSVWEGKVIARKRTQDQAYASLSALPLAARRDAFRSMTNEQRSSLWRTHLTKALNERDLTGPQRSIIAQTIAAATPEFFARHGSLDALSIKDNFTGKEAREIFAQLGGPPPLNHHVVMSPACECSHTSDYCSTNCFGNGCTVSDYGCGSLWVYSCDGLCRVAEGGGYGGLGE